LCTKLALFTRLYSDVRSTKHKKCVSMCVTWSLCTEMQMSTETCNVRIVYYWSAFTESLLSWKINKCYIFGVCICSHRYSACNAHAPYYYMCRVRPHPIFPNYFIKGRFFPKNKTKFTEIKCGFWFSLQILSEINLIFKDIERDMITRLL